jgi:hypothetical protein
MDGVGGAENPEADFGYAFVFFCPTRMTEQRKGSFVHFAGDAGRHDFYFIIAVEVDYHGKRVMHFASFFAYVVEHARQGADLGSVYSADIVVSNRFSCGGMHTNSMAVFPRIVNIPI